VGLAVLWCLDRRAVHALPACLIVAALLVQQFLMKSSADTQLLWSPYYKVVVTPVISNELKDGFSVQVNDQFLLTGLHMDSSAPIQDMKDTDPEARKRNTDAIRNEQVYHEFPFRLRSKTKRVLVLGAGVGNDVALALRFGAEKVVAVEIDPVVLKLGKQHPDQPYDRAKYGDRVEVIYNDARAYLNNTDEKFDLVLFATLDAHGLLSSVGSLRLDSFVYTQESLTAAKRHLADNGLLILSFGPFRPETQYRQYCTLRNVFGAAPRFFIYGNVDPGAAPLGNQTLVAGDVGNLDLQQLPSQWREVSKDEVDKKLAEYPSSVMPATDDWPHLYIKERRIPTEYLFVLGGILLVSAAMVYYHFRSDGFRPDGHFFFLGAAFLLMETKGITELSLLLGSTWQVNAVVFVVILIVILLANLLILRLGRPVFVPVAFGLLGLTLASEYAWPVSTWGQGLGSGAPFLGALYLGVPIFFAAVIFASTFSQAKVASAALASNLLGSVFGGVTEYLSLAYGIRFLSLLALAMYAGAFVFWLWQQRGRAAQAPAIVKDDPTTAFAAQPGV
jgi:SAM-dependent methyltransferase